MVRHRRSGPVSLVQILRQSDGSECRGLRHVPLGVESENLRGSRHLSAENRANSKFLDNMGRTADGADVAQWDGGTSNNQKWNVIALDSVWFKLQCVSSGKYLDTLGHTADGSTIGQWTGGGSLNQQWAFHATDSGYYKLINRSNGKCVDTGGQTANGASMQNWNFNSSINQQWKFGP